MPCFPWRHFRFSPIYGDKQQCKNYKGITAQWTHVFHAREEGRTVFLVQKHHSREKYQLIFIFPGTQGQKCPNRSVHYTQGYHIQDPIGLHFS